MEAMHLWDLDIHLQSFRSFPEVGVEFSVTSSVYYKGTKASPPDSAVVFIWSREFKTAWAPVGNLGSKENLGFFRIENSTTQVQPSLPLIWTVVGSSRTYVPSNEDVGGRLRLVSYATNHMGVQMSSTFVMMFGQVRPLCPSPRCIIPTLSGLKKLTKHQSVGDGGGFRILSYNLLADIYVKTGRDDYGHCPSEKLTWEYRRQNLLTEILSYQADILCLQEVQSDHFKDFLEPELAKFGYSSIYKRKTKELYNGKNYVTDGCATFFDRDKFNMVKNYEVEYEKMALPIINRLKSGHRQQGISRLMKDNIATVVILEETKNCHSRICVANTHLHSGKGASDVRLFQAISLIRGLEKINSGIPVLVCGDMNSAPGSDTHAFLVDGKVGYLRQEKKDILGISKFLKLNHSMNLANAYSGALEVHQNETLDYILYSQNNLKVDGVLEFSSYESIGKKRLLPTPQWSSDHVALVVNLRIKKAYREQNHELQFPVDPWEELKQVKVKNNYMEIKHQQTFKKSQQKNHAMFDQKKALLGNLSIQERLIIESITQQCSLNPHSQRVLMNIINQQHISCQ